MGWGGGVCYTNGEVALECFRSPVGEVSADLAGVAHVQTVKFVQPVWYRLYGGVVVCVAVVVVVVSIGHAGVCMYHALSLTYSIHILTLLDSHINFIR